MTADALAMSANTLAMAARLRMSRQSRRYGSAHAH